MKEIKFKYQKGDIILGTRSSYKIIDTEIIKEKNWRRANYICECLKDGYIFNRRQSELDKNYNCPICSFKKTVLGFNTVYDLKKDLIKYFDNIEDSKKYSPNSNKSVMMKCPICNLKKNMKICNLNINGFFCDYCSDNISYPNKFVRAFLKQLNINFIPEKSFEWSCRRLYDQYIPDFNLIIENHGEQHYIDKKLFYRDNMSIDKIKKEMAIQNGINNYIELDCRESNMLFIKNSIMKSKLPNILNFKEEDINWEECEKFASSSLLIKVCELWNEGYLYQDIINELNICYDTVKVYLRKGKNIGLVSPLKINEHIYDNQIKYTNTYNGCPIYCETDNIYFASRSLCAKYYNRLGIKMDTTNLSRAIKRNYMVKQKRFQNITQEDFNEIKQKSLYDSSIKVIGEEY